MKDCQELDEYQLSFVVFEVASIIVGTVSVDWYKDKAIEYSESAKKSRRLPKKDQI